MTSIGWLLPRVYEPFLRSPPPGLTHQQVLALCHLELDRPITITALAEKLGVKKSATSIMVSRLVARGLARKATTETDGRAVHVLLTPEGARAKGAPAAVDHDRLRDALVERGPEWAARFRNLLCSAASLVLHGDTRLGLQIVPTVRAPSHAERERLGEGSTPS